MASRVPRELIAGFSFYSFRGSNGYEGPPFPITTTLKRWWKVGISMLFITIPMDFITAYVTRDSLKMDKLVLVIGLFSWSFLVVHLRHIGEQGVSLLFVLPPCDVCSPAWQFRTTWVASCKRPFKLIVSKWFKQLVPFWCTWVSKTLSLFWPFNVFWIRLSFLFRQVDVNECTTDAHSCNFNAYCNNTSGSYNCNCNPGFSGNGISCTGK